MIDPRFETVTSWAQKTTPFLTGFGTIPKLLGDDWRKWANYIVSLPLIAATNAPRPAGYDSWQKWALAFNLVVGSITGQI